MNLGTNNKLMKRELIGLSEQKWWGPLHNGREIPVFTFAGFPLCYAVFTSPELCKAAIEEHFKECEVAEVTDCRRFVEVARFRKTEVLIDLNARTGEFSTVSPFDETPIGQA